MRKTVNEPMHFDTLRPHERRGLRFARPLWIGRRPAQRPEIRLEELGLAEAQSRRLLSGV